MNKLKLKNDNNFDLNQLFQKLNINIYLTNISDYFEEYTIDNDIEKFNELKEYIENDIIQTKNLDLIV